MEILSFEEFINESYNGIVKVDFINMYKLSASADSTNTISIDINGKIYLFNVKYKLLNTVDSKNLEIQKLLKPFGITANCKAQVPYIELEGEFDVFDIKPGMNHLTKKVNGKILSIQVPSFVLKYAKTYFSDDRPD